MSTMRSALAVSAPPFGRRARGFDMAEPLVTQNSRSDDVRLFAFTFLAGFLFMTVYLA